MNGIFWYNYIFHLANTWSIVQSSTWCSNFILAFLGVKLDILTLQSKCWLKPLNSIEKQSNRVKHCSELLAIKSQRDKNPWSRYNLLIDHVSTSLTTSLSLQQKLKLKIERKKWKLKLKLTTCLPVWQLHWHCSKNVGLQKTESICWWKVAGKCQHLKSWD